MSIWGKAAALLSVNPCYCCFASLVELYDCRETLGKVAKQRHTHTHTHTHTQKKQKKSFLLQTSHKLARKVAPTTCLDLLRLKLGRKQTTLICFVWGLVCVCGADYKMKPNGNPRHGTAWLDTRKCRLPQNVYGYYNWHTNVSVFDQDLEQRLTTTIRTVATQNSYSRHSNQWHLV